MSIVLKNSSDLGSGGEEFSVGGIAWLGFEACK